MSPGKVVLGGFVGLVALGYVLDGVADPQVWAALFWLSALGNVVLLAILAHVRGRS